MLVTNHWRAAQQAGLLAGAHSRWPAELAASARWPARLPPRILGRLHATRRRRKALAALSAMAQRRACTAWSAAAADAPQAHAPESTTQGDVPTVRGDQRRQAA